MASTATKDGDGSSSLKVCNPSVTFPSRVPTDDEKGIVTVLVAFASFWMLHDYPNTARFLTDDERRVLQARLLLDNDGCSHEYKKRFIKDAFLDWKIWVAAVMFHAALMPVYTFSLFSPTLTANLGYTAATAQLVSQI